MGGRKVRLHHGKVRTGIAPERRNFPARAHYCHLGTFRTPRWSKGRHSERNSSHKSELCRPIAFGQQRMCRKSGFRVQNLRPSFSRQGKQLSIAACGLITSHDRISKATLPQRLERLALAKADVDTKTLFFSIGEPSGDQHAARLIAELQRRPKSRSVICRGFGGPEMRAAKEIKWVNEIK